MKIILFARPAGFLIRSYADAQQFIAEVLQPGTTEVPDADDSTLYHLFIKDKAQPHHVCLGSAHYGPDPLLAEVPCCDDKNIIKRVYAVRKSINKALR